MIFKEETIRTERLYQGSIINLRVDTIQNHQGGESKREIVEHPGGVAVIAVTEENNILLVKQFRKAIDKVLLELPAGKIEKDEAPELTAIRELKEETGYTASEVEYFLSFYSSPGFSNEIIYIYLAKGLTPGEPCPDDNEHIDVYHYKIDELIAMIESGKIMDSKTIAGLYALKNKKDT